MAASRGRRIWTRTIAALAAAWVLLCAGFYLAMRQPPSVFGQVAKRLPMPLMMVLPFETMWNHARGGTVQIGMAAPEFTLPTLDHSQRVSLSSFRGSRPVVLVFGSYT